jgi:HK97 gp10 family phage protein
MSLPKSVTKIKKNGVEYSSSVDRMKYTLAELSRAALRDVAKLVRKRMIEKLKKLPGMKLNRRIYSSTQYWVRKKESDLQIGFKHDAWYGVDSEMGTSNQPARNILRDTVFENIDEIRTIEGKYLSAIEDTNKASAFISEEEYKSGDGEDD